MIDSKIFFKKGRELLPPHIVKEFQEIRSIQYWNILNNRLSDYTWAEWLTCLKEKVLLEQCLPFVFEKLDIDPLIPGCFDRGEVLYAVTRIDKSFWNGHRDWYERTGTYIDAVQDKCEKEPDNRMIREEFLEAYKSF